MVWYLSSTSVYGNHNGKWLMKKQKHSPTTTRGKRFSVENLFMESFRRNFPTHIFDYQVFMAQDVQ